jgi:hypothetical protein
MSFAALQGSRMDLGSALDSRGRATFVADAHLDDGKWFVVWADEELTAFLELEPATRAAATSYGAKLHWRPLTYK